MTCSPRREALPSNRREHNVQNQVSSHCGGRSLDSRSDAVRGRRRGASLGPAIACSAKCADRSNRMRIDHFAFVSAATLYALGGHDELARRLAGSALGGSIALAVVKLLDYVLP